MKILKNLAQLFIILFCVVSFSYGMNSKYIDSIIVSNAIGYSMSHENFKQINNKKIDVSYVQQKLQTYLKTHNFRFQQVLLTQVHKLANNLHIEGVIVYADSINRNIDTKFKANCTIKNQNLIVVNNVKLKNYAKPRSLFFIAPASKLKISQLKNMNFIQALKKVNSVARKLSTPNTRPDLQAKKYKIIDFMMNRISDEDEIYAVLSDSSFSGKGKAAQSLKTKDGWKIFTLDATFAYNGNQPKYFNVLWKKDDCLVAVESFSTFGLIKQIQLALSSRGYNPGISNGVLNKKTIYAIKQYLKKSGFYKNSRITDSLLWFMQRYKINNVSKIVQATLLENGINIGKIDGKIGSGTIRGIKKYQKELGLKTDGKITPELVKLLIQTSINADIYSRLRKNYNRPFLINLYQNKMWPNELF